MNVFEGNDNRQINFSVSVPEWKATDSLATTKTSRAMPITDTSFGTDKSFNLIADQNDGAGNYNTLIDKESVTYTNNIWKTSNDYYWSGIANKTISFYAYYPTSISGNISHTAGSSPILSYTVPDNVSDQIDIMTATNNNVNGNTNSSTSLTFNHIFSAVQFNIGSSGMPNGTITGIALNNILCKGTYNFNGTWTQDATTKKSFSQAVSSSTTGSTVITSGATTFMMMPQTLRSDASITVTYSNGSTLTQSIAGTWTAGNIYTYNISKTIPVANFAYTGSVQTYTVPLTGTYKLEVWGAQGTDFIKGTGGNGGYSYGTISLTKNKVLYVCVGGQGNPPTYSSDFSYSVSGKSLGGTGGYNGGGNGGDGFTAYSGCGGGGGATHIATYNGVLKELSSNQASVVIVAGGGGSTSEAAGGGINGISSTNGTYTSAGGGQTSGYQFGQGQAGYTKTAYGSSGAEGNGGAGGGWYGGYSYQTGNGNGTNVGGGGGSGHLGSGVTGSTIAGNTSFTDYDGTTVTGHSGNGYARITFVSAN